jgi:hypothetical protein
MCTESESNGEVLKGLTELPCFNSQQPRPRGILFVMHFTLNRPYHFWMCSDDCRLKDYRNEVNESLNVHVAL